MDLHSFNALRTQAVSSSSKVQSVDSSDLLHIAPVGSERPRDNVLMQRAMEDFKAYRFPPPQTNTLAFFFDPSGSGTG